MQKNTKTREPWIKRGPLKTFMFFLGFSAVIWIFVQFSEQYVEMVELPLEYINVPKDKILNGNNQEMLTLRVRQNGFNIARYRLFPPELSIDVTSATEQGNILLYNLEDQKPALLSQLGLEYEDVNFMDEELRISFEQKAVKTVQVVSNIHLDFSVGYSALEEIRIDPDTVQISGPASVLDTIEEIGTVALEISNISHDIQGKVKLHKGNFDEVTLFNEEVNYSLRTAKFTEGRVKIPVELINVPEGNNVVIFPKEVVVFYQVSLDDFEKIKPSSFKVVVDFENTMAGDGFLLAQVVQKPSIVTNVRLSEKRVQFVIKR